MDTFGDKLKRARERKGFSQTEVYRRTKINNKTLSRYEKDGSEPDFDTLKILAALYEVNIEDLIGVNAKSTSSIEETERQKKIRRLHELANEAKTEKELDSAIIVLESIFKK